MHPKGPLKVREVFGASYVAGFSVRKLLRCRKQCLGSNSGEVTEKETSISEKISSDK